MQELKFVNGNGSEINLTSGNFGITNWAGLGNTNLNIQTQQVPYNDGSVFIDGLLQNRTLTFTLAINDDNDLELRYELKRQLISALNPKLKEGYLYYKNDYLKKRIKVIPELPIFNNKNSNDSGTLKASVSFTSCSVYWEDVEETFIDFGNNIISIENKGDIPINLEMKVIGQNFKNPTIMNITNNQKIKLNGTYSDVIDINTNVGNKEVLQEKIDFNYQNGIKFVQGVSNLDKTILVGQVGSLICENNQKWVFVPDNLNFICSKIIYEKNMYLKVGRYFTYSYGRIYKSSDGENWTEVFNVSGTITDICYNPDSELFIATSGNGNIYKSSDGENWTEQTITSYGLNTICYSSELSLYVTIANGNSPTLFYTSSDGENWTEGTFSAGPAEMNRIIYHNIFIAVGYNGVLYTSPDGENWTHIGGVTNRTLRDVIYDKNSELFYIVGASNTILTSSDGENWEVTTVESVGSETYMNIFYSEQFRNLLITINEGLFRIEENEEWILQGCLSRNISNSYIDSETNLCYFISYGTGQVGMVTKGNNKIGWTSAPVNTSYVRKLNAITKSNGILYVVGIDSGTRGVILKSSDGENWTEILYETSNFSNLNSIIFSKKLNKLIVVGKNRILTSSDGENWTEISISGILNEVIYIESLEMFVAVGDSGIILTSSDGENWTTQTSGTTKNLNHLCWAETFSEIVITGNDGVLLKSKDAEIWTLTTISYSGNFIKYIPELGFFYMGTSNGVVQSTDAKNWDYLSTIFIRALEYSIEDKLLYMGSNDSAIFSSFYKEENNLINTLDPDSNIDLKLEIGINKLKLSYESGSAKCLIKYRQKYVGV